MLNIEFAIEKLSLRPKHYINQLKNCRDFEGDLIITNEQLSKEFTQCIKVIVEDEPMLCNLVKNYIMPEVLLRAVEILSINSK